MGRQLLPAQVDLSPEGAICWFCSYRLSCPFLQVSARVGELGTGSSSGKHRRLSPEANALLSSTLVKKAGNPWYIPALGAESKR